MSGPGEIWRGSANAWESDHLGHLNTRFYLAKVEQALPALLAELGLGPGEAVSIAEQHIRFHKEVRVGAALHMTGQRLCGGADGSELLLTLYHSNSGSVAATFRLKLGDYAGPGPAPSLGELPSCAAERGLSMRDLAAVQADRARADSLGLQRTGLLTVLADQCDQHGIWRLSAAMGLIADSVAHLQHGNWHRVLARDNGSTLRLGSVVLEFGFVHRRWPSLGDRVEVRSALSGCTDRITRTAHWLLDPVSGLAWAMVRTVGLPLDLDTRCAVPITAEAQAAYRELAVADA